MAEENTLWQQLMNNVSQQKQVVQTPVVQPQTIDLLGQPQSVAQVLNQNQPSIFVGEPVSEIEDDEDEDGDIPFEEGVDEPNQVNTFSLENLISPVIPLANQQVVTDIFSMAGGVNPVTSVTNQSAPVVEVTPPKKRGRPPLNKSQDITNVLNQMPVTTEQELSKSNQIFTQGNAKNVQERKDIAVALPKQTLREIGEALQRIGSACISVANS